MEDSEKSRDLLLCHGQRAPTVSPALASVRGKQNRKHGSLKFVGAAYVHSVIHYKGSTIDTFNPSSPPAPPIDRHTYYVCSIEAGNHPTEDSKWTAEEAAKADGGVRALQQVVDTLAGLGSEESLLVDGEVPRKVDGARNPDVPLPSSHSLRHGSSTSKEEQNRVESNIVIVDVDDTERKAADGAGVAVAMSGSMSIAQGSEAERGGKQNEDDDGDGGDYSEEEYEDEFDADEEEEGNEDEEESVAKVPSSGAEAVTTITSSVGAIQKNNNQEEEDRGDGREEAKVSMTMKTEEECVTSGETSETADVTGGLNPPSTEEQWPGGSRGIGACSISKVPAYLLGGAEVGHKDEQQ